MICDDLDYGKAEEALAYIRSVAGDFQPRTALVLGSGLGAVADVVEEARVIETRDVPHWPISTAPGHAGKIVLGTLEGRPVVLLKGRVHYYEGYGMKAVTFPARVVGMWGVSQYVATNAAGGIDHDMTPGDIVIVEDHINHMGANPLSGPAEPRWNVRFPDMTRAYSPRMIRLCEEAASERGVAVRRGVYIAFSGPSYETPAEIRMARSLGAAVVGMSTVPEVIVANAMGIETAVVSCVANQAAGMSGEKLTEEEVLTAMAEASERIGALLRTLMRRLEDEKL